MIDMIIPAAIEFDNGVVATTTATDNLGTGAMVQVAGRTLGWIGIDPYDPATFEVWPENTAGYVPATTADSATNAIGTVLEAHGLVTRIAR